MSVIFQKRKIYIKTVLTIKSANIRGNGLFKWKLTNIGDISYDRHHFVLFFFFLFFQLPEPFTFYICREHSRQIYSNRVNNSKE